MVESIVKRRNRKSEGYVMKKKQVVIYSFTQTGKALAEVLSDKLEQDGYECTGYTVARFAEKGKIQALSKDWKKKMGISWGACALVFIGAAGIAVRAIAPFVKDKFTDPPVIVLDEKGAFVIPLLSGHVGGGVELSRKLAEYTKGQTVITTATDVQKKFAVDVFAKKNDLLITDRNEAKEISAKILEQKRIGLFSEFPFLDQTPKEVMVCHSVEDLETCDGKIIICQHEPKEKQPDILYLLPKNVYVGMGCRKGVGQETLEQALYQVLYQQEILPQQISALGSIDLKKEEVGMLGLADALGVGFFTYSAEELQRIPAVSTSSSFVRNVTGVDNVCERAARIMCPEGHLIQEKVCLQKCTVSLVCSEVKLTFNKEEHP